MRWYAFAITSILSVAATMNANGQDTAAAAEEELGIVKPRPPVVLVGAMLSKEWLSFSPASNACSQSGQQDDGYYCIRADDKQYHGNPGLEANDFKQSFTPTTRLMAAVEVVLPLNLTIGARLGYALGDSALSKDGSEFSRLHAEGRLSFWFLRDSFIRRGIRPFAFVSGGIAQFDLKLGSASVVESENCNTSGTQGFCEVRDNTGQVVQYNPQGQTLNASYRTHKGFVGFGAGAMFALRHNHGPVLDLKVMKMLSDDAWVFSPSVGYMVGF